MTDNPYAHLIKLDDPAPADELPDPLPVPVEVLRTVLDLAVGSLNFGSGWWEQEDTDAARALAELLGVCPNAATPTLDLHRYPDCGHLQIAPYKPHPIVGHTEHGWPVDRRR